MSNRVYAIVYAILAALCYGVSAPVSKVLLAKTPPVFLAGLLYTGAGFGMLCVKLLKNKSGKEGKKTEKTTEATEARITKKELPYTIGMVVLDVLAPLFLMIGLSTSSAATASLLNNFEIAATSLIAFIVFKEAVGKRTWIALLFITIGSVILSIQDFSSIQDISSLRFSTGSLFVLLACVCWGFENNCTRKLSLKDPLEIVIIKGIGSGVTALVIGFMAKQYTLEIKYILIALCLGFAAYGLSVYFYIYAQRSLGAARTSAYYAVAPFIGAGLSCLLFKELPTTSYVLALGIMMLGVYFTAFEKHEHQHDHTDMEHEHRHNHTDGHHTHRHEQDRGEHSHRHRHSGIQHQHQHTPDLHHAHEH